MSDRKKYRIELTRRGGTRLIPFRSPSNLYDPIMTELGVKYVTTRDNILSSDYGSAGELLPRLRLKLEGGGTAGDDGNTSSLVFCDPGKLETALWQLKGKRTRGKLIADVKIPKKIVYV